jgi:hypothetical protein
MYMLRPSPSNYVWRCVAALVVALLACTVGHGIRPARASDEELARHPIIVVGRWNKTPLRVHDRTIPCPEKGPKDVICTDTETHTELVVECVIKGKIAPGTHRILLGFRLGWLRPDGGNVVAYWSSEQWGDVEEVCEPNLWFLVRTRSWDKSDRHTYLMLDTYRGVQPLRREEYFRGLAEQYGEGEEEDEETSDTIAWPWAIGEGVAVILVAFMAWRWRKRRRRGKAKR